MAHLPGINEIKDCLFCCIKKSDIIAENDSGFAIFDRYPVAPGHVLVIPRRHTPDFFHLTSDEVVDLYDLLVQCRRYLVERFNPDGFNIGINNGKRAGQTIFHLHIHLIPRYKGDHPNPLGGVRHIIPGKGTYPAV